MKVHEIIKEENVVGNILRTAARPFVEPVVKGVAGLMRGNVEEKEAIAKIAAKWAEELKNKNQFTTKAGDILDPVKNAAGKTIRNPMAKDPKIIAAAEKQAKDIVKADAKLAKDAAYTANKELVKTGATAVAKQAMDLANFAGWAVPMTETALEIGKLNAALSAGKISTDNYNQQVQLWLGKCVSQIIAIKIAGGAVNVAGKFVGSIPLLPFGGHIGEWVSKASPAAKAAFAAWLLTPDGNAAFVKWYVGKSFLPGVAEFARDWVGSLAKQGFDAVVGGIKQFTGVELGGGAAARAAAAAPDDGFGDAITPDANASQGMKFDLGSGEWTNRPNR